MKKSISVIIPTYNRVEYLTEAIESVASNLSDYESEIIVVDDGSTDGTKNLLKNLTSKHNNLKILDLPHTGRPGAVRNAGLAEASKDLIAFQDSDDIWVQGKIERQLEAFEDDVILVYGNISYINEAGEETSGPILKPGKQRSGYIFPQLIDIHRQPVPAPTVVVRRTAIEQVGKFNDYLPLATDTEYWIRLAAIGNFNYIDEVLALVRRHESNISTISENLEGVFMDRMNQISIYRSVIQSSVLNAEQEQQIKWAEIEVIDQIKKLSGRYAHSLADIYDGPQKTKLKLKRHLRLLRDLFSNFVYYIRNL